MSGEHRTVTRASGSIELGVAVKPLTGEVESGDLHVVKSFDGGVLIGVVDGLGHGHEARVAAERAAAILSAHPHESVASLVHRCHETLRTTRGVVLGLASFSATAGSIRWIGVGNVEGAVFSARRDRGVDRKDLFSLGGLVGSRLPTLNPVELPVGRGDLLLLATDGIEAGFAEEVVTTEKPAQKIADDLLTRRARGTDDALVLAARFLGPTR